MGETDGEPTPEPERATGKARNARPPRAARDCVLRRNSFRAIKTKRQPNAFAVRLEEESDSDSSTETVSN